MIFKVGYTWNITAQIGADISTFKNPFLLQAVNIRYMDRHYIVATSLEISWDFMGY
jgi:hypothetical protein